MIRALLVTLTCGFCLMAWGIGVFVGERIHRGDTALQLVRLQNQADSLTAAEQQLARDCGLTDGRPRRPARRHR